MDENWWPALLADMATEAPWSQPDVVVAEVSPEGGGERMISAALVPIADLDALAGNLASVSYKVDTNGPRPEPGGVPYQPSFWIHGGPDGKRLEPLVASWMANNRVTHVVDPGFLMTYGLMPRVAEEGGIAYDDPTGPAYDVARVSGPARYDFPTWTPAAVRIQRDYLQDYLTLRQTGLVQGFYAKRVGPMDAECASLLGDQDAVEVKFADREFQLNRRRGEGAEDVIAQVWGGRIVGRPGTLPISTDIIGTEGLEWPGIKGAVRPDSFRTLCDPWVFVRDEVLSAYEDRPDFRIFPETGGVDFGGQWGVGFCHRVGRDLIKLELRKLYEGAPAAVIQHWHAYAVAPPAQVGPAANIASRAHGIADGLLALGDALDGMSGAVGGGGSAADYTGLDRAWMDRNGWWAADPIVPITRHVPMEMRVGDFLTRCIALDNLVGEGLSRRALRQLCRSIGFPDKETKELGALKLLDLLVRFGAEAYQLAAALPDEAADIASAVLGHGDSERPLTRLFALNDLRNLGAHAGRDDAKLVAALGRFERDPAEGVAGFGAILDHVYDVLAEDLRSAAQTIDQAVRRQDHI